MIWLIDEGDDYHQMVAVVAKGEKHPKSVIVSYRKKHELHCKEWSRLEAKYKKTVSKEPNRDKQSVNRVNYVIFFRKWRSDMHFWINERLQNPVPDLKVMLEKAGYEVLPFENVRLCKD